MCLNKQQKQAAVAYVRLNCCFMFDPNIFCQIIGIPMGSNSARF